MDRVIVGKFIAKCRKEKKLTQEQLAEILGVTNKSVSKWENGVCLPDAFLYEPLCAELEITINELFAGHRIKDEDYKRIADENLMQMLKYKLYSLSNKDISFNEFDNALMRISELTAQLKAFKTKHEAVIYLTEQTHSSIEGEIERYINRNIILCACAASCCAGVFLCLDFGTASGESE